MKATIDKAGRVVIPALVRQKAGFKPGTELDVVVDEDSSVRLVRRVAGPRLAQVGKRLIARPAAAPAKLPAVDIASLVDEERSRWPW